MNAITANELKTKGVSVIEHNLIKEQELIITVRGKERFVVMDMQQYNYLRECELGAALQHAREQYLEGNYISESVEEHIKRISK